MGLKPGEKLERLGPIRVVSVRREYLCLITTCDVIKEGFPGMSRYDFVKMFCEHMNCGPRATVTRIEFEYL